MSCDIRRTLPKTGFDGQEICDRYGIVWIFDSETKSWVQKGQSLLYPIVDEQNDGLVSPEIFSLISSLKSIDKADFQPLKLFPNDASHYYYFKSTDKKIKFIPENENTLRIEFDRARYYRLLMQKSCPGVRGPKGEKGDKGEDGIPALPESCYKPSLDRNQLKFSIYTPTPLVIDGPVALENNHVPDISIRLFLIKSAATSTNLGPFPKEVMRLRSLGFTVDDALVGHETEVFSSVVILYNFVEDKAEIITTGGLPIDISRTTPTISLDAETNILSGTIYLFAGNEWKDEWCVKSQQRGPDGPRGDNATCSMIVNKKFLSTSSTYATCPIINVRLDETNRTLYTYCADIFLDNNAANFIQIPLDSGPLNDRSSIESRFASVSMTLDNYKRIGSYFPELSVPEIEDPDLVNWKPQAGCLSERHYDKYEFDWVSQTDLESCLEGSTWYGPDGPRPALYPYEILKPDRPPIDECCADTFFYCSNVQDAPCDTEPPSTNNPVI